MTLSTLNQNGVRGSESKPEGYPLSVGPNKWSLLFPFSLTLWEFMTINFTFTYVGETSL